MSHANRHLQYCHPLSAFYTGSGYTGKIPPVSVSYEQGIMDDVLDVGSIGVGGYIGYTSASWETNWLGGSYGWKYTNFILGVRGSFHYPLVDNIDTYAGVLLGYNVVSAKEINAEIEYQFGNYKKDWEKL